MGCFDHSFKITAYRMVYSIKWHFWYAQVVAYDMWYGVVMERVLPRLEFLQVNPIFFQFERKHSKVLPS